MVDAPLGKDGLDGAGETGAVGEQEDNGGDAPGHADHGDGGAAAVVDHCFPGLGEDVFEHGRPALLGAVVSWLVEPLSTSALVVDSPQYLQQICVVHLTARFTSDPELALLLY